MTMTTPVMQIANGAILADGFPAPPPAFHTLISGDSALDDADYFSMGQAFAKSVADIITGSNRSLPADASVLDFGCGAGRIIRHLRDLGTLYGVDINEDLVRWCQTSLPFASFTTCGAEPPLPFAAESFDLVLSFSVFTHLSTEQQSRWLLELERVIRPDGLIVVTLHGDGFAHTLDAVNSRRYEAGELVVINPQDAGQPATYGRCSTYHPSSFVREVMAPFHGLEVLGDLPGDVMDTDRHIVAQDAYLLTPSSRSLHCVPTLVALPSAIADEQGYRTTTVAWSTPIGASRIRVSEDGGPEKPFARGNRGMAQATWIGGKSEYRFSMCLENDDSPVVAATVERL